MSVEKGPRLGLGWGLCDGEATTSATATSPLLSLSLPFVQVVSASSFHSTSHERRVLIQYCSGGVWSILQKQALFVATAMESKIVHLFVFSLAISAALALTCYKCDSSENKLCNYGIGSFTYNTVNCDEEFGGGAFTNWIPKQCVKLVAKAKDGSEYIARGCMPSLGGACSAVAKTLKFFSNVESNIEDMDCYPCDGDKCNSAPANFRGYAVLGVVLAAVAFLF